MRSGQCINQLRESLQQLQQLPEAALGEMAECYARSSAAGSNAADAPAVEWLIGTLATGGALLRLAAALAELPMAAELAPAVQVLEGLHL